MNEPTQQHIPKQTDKIKTTKIVYPQIYPDPGKLKKQMKYANDRQVPFVVLVGEEEMSNGLLGFKNMQSGEQEKLSIEEIIAKTQAL